MKSAVAILLTANLSSIALWAGPTSGLKMSTTTAVFFIASAIVGALVLARPSMRGVSAKESLGLLLVFLALFGWPSIAAVYSPADNVWIHLGRDAFLLVQFMLAYCAFKIYGLSFVQACFATAWLFIVLGVIASAVAPSVFVPALEAAAKTVFTHDRAFGFQLQPNRAADALNLVTAIALCLNVWRRMHTQVIVACAWLMLVFMTGSRGGVIVAVFLLTLLVVRKLGGGRRPFTLPAASLIVVGGVTFAVAALFLAGSMESDVAEGIAGDRLALLVGPDFEATLADPSVQSRIAYQAKYLESIAQAPLLGFGAGANEFLVRSGFYQGSSHNAVLETLSELGLIGLLLWIAVFSYPLLVGTQSARWMSVIVVVFVILTGMVSNTAISAREVFSVLGVWYGAALGGVPGVRSTTNKI